MTTIMMVGALTLGATIPAHAQQANPCAAKNPTAQKAQNPCAAKSPVAKNPCAAKAPGASPRMLNEARRPSEGDALFGAGPTLRPPEAR